MIICVLTLPRSRWLLLLRFTKFKHLGLDTSPPEIKHCTNYYYYFKVMMSNTIKCVKTSKSLLLVIIILKVSCLGPIAVEMGSSWPRKLIGGGTWMNQNLKYVTETCLAFCDSCSTLIGYLGHRWWMCFDSCCCVSFPYKGCWILWCGLDNGKQVLKIWPYCTSGQSEFTSTTEGKQPHSLITKLFTFPMWNSF